MSYLHFLVKVDTLMGDRADLSSPIWPWLFDQGYSPEKAVEFIRAHRPQTPPEQDAVGDAP